MFEELDPKNQAGNNTQGIKPAENLFEKNNNDSEKKVDDIFRDTEPAQKPSILQPKKQNNAISEMMSLAEEKKRSMRNLLFLAIAAIIFLAIAIGGYFFVINLLKRNESIEKNSVIEEKTDNINNTNIDSNMTTTESATPDISQPAPVDNTIVEDEANKDTDQDGLLDSEEAVLGTDVNLTDTDGDGLFDKEEVKIYKTDPLNPDADGDSYKDGDEVKNGYNPSGAGKLFELPQ